jgi:nucleoid DNA-binding protein
MAARESVMKMKALSEEVATACDMRARAVTSVHKETFRLLRAALEKGERVSIPDFGVFYLKDVEGKEGKPAKKVVRFKMRDPAAGGDKPARDRTAKESANKPRRKKTAKREAEKGAKEGGQRKGPASTPAAESDDA